MEKHQLPVVVVDWMEARLKWSTSLTVQGK